jgi:hypothetical protein
MERPVDCMLNNDSSGIRVVVLGKCSENGNGGVEKWSGRKRRHGEDFARRAERQDHA